MAVRGEAREAVLECLPLEVSEKLYHNVSSTPLPSRGARHWKCRRRTCANHLQRWTYGSIQSLIPLHKSVMLESKRRTVDRTRKEESRRNAMKWKKYFLVYSKFSWRWCHFLLRLTNSSKYVSSSRTNYCVGRPDAQVVRNSCVCTNCVVVRHKPHPSNHARSTYYSAQLYDG